MLSMSLNPSLVMKTLHLLATAPDMRQMVIKWWPFSLAAANIIEGKNGSVIILSSLILKFSTNLGDEGREDGGRGDVPSNRSWPLVVEDNLVTGNFFAGCRAWDGS